jgi:hypothetical protein
MTDSGHPEPTREPWWLVLRVIDEPIAVFRQLAVKPQVVVPLALLVVTALIVGFGTPASTLQSSVERQAQVLEERAPDRFDEDEWAERIANASNVRSRLFIGGIGAAVGLVVLLIAAGVLQLVFGAVGSAPLKFKDELAIVTHAYVPQLLGATLLVLLARFAGLEQMQLSLGFLFREGFLHHLGNQFTLFGAWNVFLLALGNQIRTKMKGLGAPLAIVGVLWVLVNFGRAGLASVSGGG